MTSNACCALLPSFKGSRYSNRTVKYSNKVVSEPGCSLPTYMV